MKPRRKAHLLNGEPAAGPGNDSRVRRAAADVALAESTAWDQVGERAMVPAPPLQLNRTRAGTMTARMVR
ncbi:hypothetical protein [Thiohalocapsa sp. ML1]|jgi:hypothetical protein|uniref:hypothetical protein n=1 Tax=Thiohalocapsa sp. ML1 TaxID=1431688 RepID=UPI000732374C|nr:hypothetical protein [Thiohalocapsa sp. ML1]